MKKPITTFLVWFVVACLMVNAQTNSFDTYQSAQAFVDKMYSQVIDYNKHALTTGGMFADLAASPISWVSAYKDNEGEYLSFLPTSTGGSMFQSNFYSTNDNDVTGHDENGIWPDGWRGIAMANLVLSKMDEITASADEKNKLAGQVYFLRAFYYWELARHWGGMPYIKHIYNADSNYIFQRPNAQETLLEAVNDFDLAIDLLPSTWSVDTFPTNGYPTKGAAMALKGKALLYAASPLYNLDAGQSASYNTTILANAIDAFEALIDSDFYSLVPFVDYKNNFGRNDGGDLYTTENIWQKPDESSGRGLFTGRHGRLFNQRRFGGNDMVVAPTQNLVDLFEMSNGYPISHVSSGYDSSDPWANRDPRFKAGIYTDGDLAGIAASTELRMYTGGLDLTPAMSTPYICHKFWPKGVNNIDRNYTAYTYATPHIRYADVLLMYAEAVNELYGPTTDPGSGITAVDAVNLVRTRAGMPNVHAEFTATKETFRARVINERAVELFFEGHRWHDLRRWYVAHLSEYKTLYGISFPQDHSNFTISQIGERNFTTRHYWLPIPKNDVLKQYLGYYQNLGW